MKDKPLTLGDYPRALREAYDDPDGDIMWRAGIARAATMLLRQSGGDTRERFEREYGCGDPISDAMSLARREDGEYEQSLARLCFRWFCKGRSGGSSPGKQEG